MILEESAWIMPPSLSIAISRPDNGLPLAIPASIDAPVDGLSLEDNDRSLMVRALEKTAGNQTQAARLLRLTRDTLRLQDEEVQLAVGLLPPHPRSGFVSACFSASPLLRGESAVDPLHTVH